MAVLDVAWLDQGQRQRFEREHVEVLPGHVQRRVRTDEAHGQEERRAVPLCRRLLDAVGRPGGVALIRRRIAIVLVRVPQWHRLSPIAVNPAGLRIAVVGKRNIVQRRERTVDRADAVEGLRHRGMRDALLAVKDERAEIGLVLEFVPHRWQMVVHKFARSNNVVPVGAEMRHDGSRILQDRILEPLVPEEIAGRVRVDPGQETGPRRCADRVIAVGPPERHAGPSPFFHGRRPGLRMPAHTGNVVVQVVADDQHDIGFCLCLNTYASRNDDRTDNEPVEKKDLIISFAPTPTCGWRTMRACSTGC